MGWIWYAFSFYLTPTGIFYILIKPGMHYIIKDFEKDGLLSAVLQVRPLEICDIYPTWFWHRERIQAHQAANI